MRRFRTVALLLVLSLAVGGTAAAADAAYPFIGSWIRADRSCATSPARERVYTAHDVISNRSKCTIRRVASGSGGYELFERCERAGEKPANISEVIRMTGPDSMILTRQTARLKLSRSLHFSRCAPSGSSKPGR